MTRDLAATVYAAVCATLAYAIDRAAIDRAAVGVVAARVTSAVVEVVGETTQPRERPSERRRRENAEMLAQMADEKRRGNRRGAAMIVARRFATNPRDPHSVEMTAQRVRRLRKKSEQCSVAGEKSAYDSEHEKAE